MAFVEDLSAFFADFGVPATFGALSATVLLDMPDAEIFGGGQISTDYAITYKSGDLSGLKTGDAITVNAVAYQVREVVKLDDGKLMNATLKR